MAQQRRWIVPGGLAVLVLLFNLVGCALMSRQKSLPDPLMVTPAANPPDSAGLNAVYSDPDGWYTLHYPEDWAVKKIGSELQFRADPDNTVGLAVSLWPKTTLADVLVHDVARILTDKSTAYASVSSRTLLLDAYPAVRVEHIYTLADFPQQGFMIGVTHHRVGLLFLAYAPPERYADFAPIFEAMLESVHIHRYDALQAFDLWRTTTSGSVRLHAPPASFTADKSTLIAAEHMRVYSLITEKLRVGDAGPIDLYLYPSDEILYRATARRSGFAIAPVSEIHALWVSDTDHQSLGHEMTHLIANRSFGDPAEALLGEGLAVCLDHATPSVQDRALALLQQDQIVPLADLMGDAWFAVDPAVAYIESGSLVCWLMENYGVEAVTSLYTRSDIQAALEEVTGFGVAELEQHWLAWLKGVTITP